jgi:hypothetical protein
MYCSAPDKPTPPYGHPSQEGIGLFPWGSSVIETVLPQLPKFTPPKRGRGGFAQTFAMAEKTPEPDLSVAQKSYP